MAIRLEMIFRATGRFIMVWWARKTPPMPPRPNSSISLYLPRKKELRPASNCPACQRVSRPFCQDLGRRCVAIVALLADTPSVGQLLVGEQVALSEDLEQIINRVNGHA